MKITVAEPPQPCFYGDRFIPRRYTIGNIQNLEKLYAKSKGFQDILDMRLQSGYWRWHNFRIILNSAFGLKPSTARIYQFSDLSVKSNIFNNFNINPRVTSTEIIYGNKNGLDWPCNPRSRPLGFADSTHDLPGFRLYSELNVIAWSSKGQIAASFGHDLVLWTPETDSTSFYAVQKSKAIAFNPQGDIMAAGCIKGNKSVIELWDVTTEDFRNIKDYKFSSEMNEVRCIEWDPTGQILICGNKTGCLYFFNATSLWKIKEIRNHKLPISAIKFSPKSNYLATADIEGNIYILLWNSCDIHVRLISQRKLRTMMDWHPWNGTDLVISEELPASIAVLNVPSKEIVAYYQRKDFTCRIDSVIFNKLSGELVVSYTIRDANESVSNEIVVMASLDRIVDVLKTHEDSVKFLLWSPDNLQLATAGDDDTLTIWNFFGIRDKYKLQKLFKKDRFPNKSENFISNQFVDILNTYVRHSKNLGGLK